MIAANFLPWRRRQRMRRLRFWSALFFASLLATAAATLSLLLPLSLATRALHSELAEVNKVRHALDARQKAWLALQRKSPASGALPQPVSWSPVLVSLAASIPEQAWLTELRFHPPFLSVTGYAARIVDLSAMTDALKQISGFSPGATGALQQDPQGRWMFTFQLKNRG